MKDQTIRLSPAEMQIVWMLAIRRGVDVQTVKESVIRSAIEYDAYRANLDTFGWRIDLRPNENWATLEADPEAPGGYVLSIVVGGGPALVE